MTFGYCLKHMHLVITTTKSIYALFVWACLAYKPWLKVLLAGLV